ncbi:hypothetical protein BKA61DRAFT_662797 [Leptodontidium sp. MPI-SDFR-AT-0119]|nr:hypothetical protein BKA61DRAFT_662797 [Leptodontidium sp. MPI-SDFR-AT-0119]
MSAQRDLQAVLMLQWALEKVALEDVLESPVLLLSTPTPSPDPGVTPGPESLPLDHDISNPWPSTKWSPRPVKKRRLSPQQNSTRSAPVRKCRESVPLIEAALACSPLPQTSPPGRLPRDIDGGRADGGQTQAETYNGVSPSATALVNPAQGTPPVLLREAREFFEARLGSRKPRARYLVRAVQGFLEASPLSPDFSRDMWNEKSAIFSKPQGAGSTERFRSLFEGHRKIKRGGEHYLSAMRFCYIYLEHDLEHIMASQELVLSQGRGKVTAAFQLQAESISIAMDTLRAERKAGRGYIRLLMEGGPGFVLRMGKNVSTIWERKLSAEDIALIIEFIKMYAVDMYNDIKSFDRVAVQALFYGFIAYGWTLSEIQNTKSSLFEELQRYVNLDDEQLASVARELSPAESSVIQDDLAPFEPFDLDLLLNEGSQMIATHVPYLEGSEPAIVDQDFELPDMFDLEINQDPSGNDYDAVFGSVLTCVPQTHENFDLFHELFPGLSSPEQSDGWL